MAANSTKPKTNSKPAVKKRLDVKFNALDLNTTTEETERGVINIPGKWPYFNFGGLLSYTANEAPTNVAKGINKKTPPKITRIKAYKPEILQLRVEQSVKHYKIVKGKNGPKRELIPTPMVVVMKLFNYPSSRAPVVKGLSMHPLIDRTGRVISKEGIDHATGILIDYGGTTFPRLSRATTKKLARKAAQEIFNSLFSEFCFKGHPSNNDLFKVTALALLMTGILRKILDQTPGFSIDGNVQGTGKTTLARMVYINLTGQDMPVYSLGVNPEEQKKEMLSTLLQSPAMVTFDNIPDGSEVSTPVLARVITSSSFTSRLLGHSTEVTVPTNTVICLTGNNLTFDSDLVRRFATIALTVDQEQPETRIFKNSDVLEHCLTVRENVIMNCLTIIKAYIQNGSPLNSMNLKSSGFRQWDEMVRFPLLWATNIDILEALDVNREQSTEQRSMKGIVLNLHSIYPNAHFTATQLLSDLTTEDGTSNDLDYLKECFSNLSIKALSSTRSLSAVLRKLVGRIIDNKRLVHQTDKHGNFGKFFIQEVKK